MQALGIHVRRGQAGFLQHALQAFLAALGLAGVLPGHVAPDVFFFLQDKRLLGFVFLQPAGVAFLALLQKGGVIAAVDFQRGGHLPDGVGHLVEEVAVVRNDQHRPRPIGHKIFQPFDGGDIQVIGRLVHQ